MVATLLRSDIYVTLILQMFSSSTPFKRTRYESPDSYPRQQDANTAESSALGQVIVEITVLKGIIAGLTANIAATASIQRVVDGMNICYKSGRASQHQYCASRRDPRKSSVSYGRDIVTAIQAHCRYHIALPSGEN